ncbi:hypothetical protein ULF88_07440 [Halopseudomonas pachastrellae]|nr:hypothetical protein [Halopseudomonas pachastrellae]
MVWGGHPAITPMIWSICEDLGLIRKLCDPVSKPLFRRSLSGREPTV